MNPDMMIFGGLALAFLCPFTMPPKKFKPYKVPAKRRENIVRVPDKEAGPGYSSGFVIRTGYLIPEED